MNKARVIRIISGEYTLYDKEMGHTLLAKPRGIFRNNNITIKVGDMVWYEKEIPFSIITDVEARKNDLVRPAICNIDQAFVVTSLKEPNLNLNLLDRFIAILEYNSILPILIFHKVDLLNEIEKKDAEKIINYYQDIGYHTLITSTLEPTTFDIIKGYLKDKVSVFTGQSGVGKSSILNVVDANYALQTNAISKALNRGKHTTRSTTLLSFGEGWVADSPGFGIVDLMDMDQVDLSHSFIEFFQKSSFCKYNGCLHLNEPHCAIKSAVEKKEILLSRYENYLQISNEIKQKRKW
ncbi:MAG: ribosome small subunit-dependent GTPase A [Anaeroplasma bactoclasticum]|nr:ribosome small subunit-dependent GTPase A [Anaeroplasma bactoclasticum]